MPRDSRHHGKLAAPPPAAVEPVSPVEEEEEDDDEDDKERSWQEEDWPSAKRIKEEEACFGPSTPPLTEIKVCLGL